MRADRLTSGFFQRQARSARSLPLIAFFDAAVESSLALVEDASWTAQVDLDEYGRLASRTDYVELLEVKGDHPLHAQIPMLDGAASSATVFWFNVRRGVETRPHDWLENAENHVVTAFERESLDVIGQLDVVYVDTPLHRVSSGNPRPPATGYLAAHWLPDT